MALNQNTLLKLAERDGANCHYCAHELDPDGPLRPTVDHIVPRFLNGSNRLHNLVLACEPCNRRKGNAMLHFDCDQCNAARAAEARHRVLRSRDPNPVNDLFVNVEAGTGKLPLTRNQRRRRLRRQCYHDNTAQFCVICSAI